MKFPKFSKNKLSGAIFLLLIILLSQSSILDMLFNTTLGRLSLVSLILGAGYLNKFMGIAAVLIAVVMFSSFGNVFEGNTTMAEGEKQPVADLVKGLNEMMEQKMEEKEEEKKTEETKTEGFIDYTAKERDIQMGYRSKHSNNANHSTGNFAPFSWSDLIPAELTFSKF
jgi:hypothetical protein